jgi:hypothetical protein
MTCFVIGTHYYICEEKSSGKKSGTLKLLCLSTVFTELRYFENYTENNYIIAVIITFNMTLCEALDNRMKELCH